MDATQHENILLTWVGQRDPFGVNQDTKASEPGPILSLLTDPSFRRIDRLVLYYTDRGTDSPTDLTWRRRAGQTMDECRKLAPQLPIVPTRIDLIDPTSIAEVYPRMQVETFRLRRRLRDEAGHDRQRYIVYRSPGTPAMQQAWTFLLMTGQFAATCIDRREKRFVGPDELAWHEVDLTLPELPAVLTEAGREQLVEAYQGRNKSLLAENERLQAKLATLRAGVPTGVATDVNAIPPDFDIRQHLHEERIRWYVRAIARSPHDMAAAARLIGEAPATFRQFADKYDLHPRDTTPFEDRPPDA